jgi:tetratricopeptide (TPR) repeat protein
MNWVTHVLQSAWRWMKDAARSRASLALGLILTLGLAAWTGCAKQTSARKHLEQANRYFQAEDYPRAEIEYLNTLRLEPANRQALINLGLIYTRQGVLPKALQLLQRARSLDTNDVEAELYLAQALQGVGDVKSARREAVAILARQPRHEQALLLLVDASVQTNELAEARQRLEALRRQAGPLPGHGLALGLAQLRQGEVKTAEASLREVLAADPKSAPAHSLLASICILSNDLKAAEQHFQAAAELAPLHSIHRLKHVEFEVQAGRLEEGRRLLEELTKKAPDYLPAWLRLAEVFLLSNRPDESDAAVKRILARDPLNYKALLLDSRLKLVRGDRAGAVQELEKLRSLYSKVPEAHYHLAVAYLANRDADKAALSLNQALALVPNYAEAELLLAEVNLGRGNRAAAIASLQGLVRRQPQLVQAWLDLGRTYQADRNPEAALGVYQRMAGLFPKEPQPLWLAGNLLQAQHKPAEARAAYEKALLLAPDQPVLLEPVLALDLQEKKTKEALQRLQGPLERHPKSAALKVLLASTQVAAGNTNQAEAALLQAIDLEPTNKAPYLALARLYIAGNRKAEAFGKLQTLAARKPKDESPYLLMAVLHQADGDHPAARAAYEQVLQLNPRSVPALNNLAYLFSEHLNQPDRAFDCASKARAVAPNDPDTADTLGWILSKRGDYPAALSLLQEGANHRPSNPEIQFHLGMTHYMLGAEEPARVALQEALSQTNQFPGRAEAEQRLAFLKLEVKPPAPAARAALDKRLSEQPTDPIALSRLGAWQEQDKAFDKALQTYAQILKSNPKAVPMLLRMARIHADHFGDVKKALELAKNARGLAPEEPNAAWLLGRLACRTGDPKWGLGLLQESAQKLPGQPELQYDLGLALYSNGRLAEAEAAVKGALQANLAFTRADAARRFLTLCSLHTDPARAQQALPQIQEALKADPDCLPALMASGVVDELTRNLPAARQTYERILAISPVFTPALRQMALLCAQTPGEEKRALEIGLRARQALPQDALLAKALGVACWRQKDASMAAELLKESARTRTDDAEVFYYLGLAQAELKNKKDSAQALNRALSLNLPPPLADEAKRTLEKLK